MNDQELARLARATWNQEPPDNLDQILPEAARRWTASEPQRRPSERLQPALAGFEAFYRSFAPRLMAHLLHQGAGMDDAADILQEAMIATYRRWNDLEQPERYALAAASRMLAKTRRSRVQPLLPLEEASKVEAADLVAARERADELWRLLALLPSRTREVFSLVFLFDLRRAEVAEILGISQGAVAQHLHRARTALQRQVKASQEGDRP